MPNAKCGQQNQKWSPTKGNKIRVVASPLPSGGPKRRRKSYVTPKFSGPPNAKYGEQNQKWSPTKGNQITSSFLTPAFSRPQKTAQMLRHPPISGMRNAKHWEENQNWLPHPCLLGCPKEGGNATPALHSRSVIPNAKRSEQNQKSSLTKGNEITIGHLKLTFSASQKRAERLGHPCILGDPQH